MTIQFVTANTAIDSNCEYWQNKKLMQFPLKYELSSQQLTLPGEMERSKVLVNQIKNQIFLRIYRTWYLYPCHSMGKSIRCIFYEATCSRWRDANWSIYLNECSRKASYPLFESWCNSMSRFKSKNTDFSIIPC